jgi:hypothetical protein
LLEAIAALRAAAGFDTADPKEAKGLLDTLA